MSFFCLRSSRSNRVSLFMFLASAFFFGQAYAQFPELKFTYLTREQGLSSSAVISIDQDSKGYMWFGTEDGLNKYDGYKVTVYKKSAADKGSGLSNNNIIQIFEDHQQRLWIATSYGLNLYDRKYDRFRRFINIRGDARSISNNNVTGIYEDAHHQIWVGTASGLARFREEDGSFERFIDESDDRGRPGVNAISFIYGLPDGNLWIGTKGAGVRLFDVAKKRLSSISTDAGQWSALKNMSISVIRKTTNGIFWIGTIGNGVFLYDAARHQITNYLEQQTNRSSLPNNVVKDILCDHSGNIWISTENGGVCLWQPQSQTFLRYDNVLRNSELFNQKTATALFEDKQHNLWIGTRKGGIYKYSPNSYLFKTYTQGNYEGALSYRDVKVFFEDKDHNIWIGIDGGGINLWNKSTGVFKRFRHDPHDPTTISSDAVLDIMQDSHSNIWIGTWAGGLNKYNPATGTFTHYLQNPKNSTSISSDNVWRVFEDSKGTLYVATYYNGLNTFDPATQKFTRITTAPDGRTKFSGNSIISICEDSRHNLWVGTLDQGLNCLSADRRTITHYFSSSEDINDDVRTLFMDSQNRLWAGRTGLYLFDDQKHRFNLYAPDLSLSNEKVQSIVEDNRHLFWIGTNNGLIRVDPRTLQMKRFTNTDGLQGLEFSINSALKMRSGELLFGGSQGFNIFNPDSIRVHDYEYPVYITDMLVFNKRVNHNAPDAPTNQAISESNKVVLKPSQSNFSFEYAALNFVAPEKTQYAYMLKGFDKNWNYVGTQRQATYTNLDPGDYTFYVKANSPDGSWKSKAAAITVTVLPPFWLTWWFETLAVLGLGTAAFLILAYRRKAELRVFNEQKREEMHQMQLQFFTNISHEFRTPLTLILGNLDQVLKKDTGSSLTRYYDTINRNASRLLHLISELMDFRKSESGALKLKVMPGNFSHFLEEIVKEFQEQAEMQHIDFSLINIPQKNETWFDRQIIEKILLNLINNSFKYTPDHGAITIEVLPSIDGYTAPYAGATKMVNDYKGHGYIYLSIKDTGIGISKDSIQHLFERYFRVSDHHLGSGIGLAFVKSLTALHKGSIYVYSEFEKGTQIIVAIPCSKADYAENELWFEETREMGVHLESITYKSITGTKAAGALQPEEDTENKDFKERPLVLIVDDNEELRIYLREILEPFYQVIEANEGLAGLIKAQEESPALIISDVMMPVMDGLDFCQRIKEDFETSHIPVILLTAKDALQSRLEGMESGADFYFSKPISVDFLLLTIKNLFKQRQNIKERYLKDYQVEVRDLVHTAKDKEVIDRLLILITEKMEDPDLNIDYVSREMGVSKSKLYKKIKDITGQSIVEFIRTIRLKKAMEIMTHEDVLITEVMYRVGILSQSYFTSAFKKEFGLTPSQFQQQLNSKTEKKKLPS